MFIVEQMSVLLQDQLYFLQDKVIIVAYNYVDNSFIYVAVNDINHYLSKAAPCYPTALA